MTHARTALIIAFLVCAVAGCQEAPRSRAERATSVACRSEVDRVYAAQNRSELTDRDQRDTPLSGSYLGGITSRGLSAQYKRDNEISACLNATRGAPAVESSPGPAFSPIKP